MRIRSAIPPVLILMVAACAAAPQPPEELAAGDWPMYGRDGGGSRFSPLARITRDNVASLEVAWTFHTGEESPAGVGRDPSLEVTPIVVDGTLYLSTPLGRVMALDPATGVERWRFDAKVNPSGGYGDFNSRGVSSWLDRSASGSGPCGRRVFVATIDTRLIALDAATGTPCADFGEAGTDTRLTPWIEPSPTNAQPDLPMNMVSSSSIMLLAL
jgi:quinoprotein glucose dehydrogenase